MFIMNFKEIHSNTEFLSTYRRARACSCRNKIKNTFIEKWLERSVQATFGTFVFCSEAVPTYSTHSQNTKFISLSRSLTACRNFFLMSVDFMVDKLIFWCYNLCSFRNKEAKYMDSCDNRSSFGDGQGLKKQMSL